MDMKMIFWQKQTKRRIPQGQYIHFDIPQTLEHECDLLKEAGFQKAEMVDSIQGATIIRAVKD